jgi:hypothetical protein
MRMKLPILCFAAIVSTTSPVLAQAQAITYVPHKDIQPISSPLGGVYNAYRWYQPSLKIYQGQGCVPFPAVGEYTASAGLKLGGARDGECSSSPGQVYARHKDFPNKGVHGIMYAYYFPKDQVFDGIAAGEGAGHRHDWEEVVVWVSWDWKRPLGASMSGHGDYTAASRDWNGSHYSVLYINGNTVDGISHELRTNNTGNEDSYYQHPLANWYQLSYGVRDTLNNAVWLNEEGKQKASPKIVDTVFDSKMQAAFAAFF